MRTLLLMAVGLIGCATPLRAGWYTVNSKGDLAIVLVNASKSAQRVDEVTVNGTHTASVGKLLGPGQFLIIPFDDFHMDCEIPATVQVASSSWLNPVQIDGAPSLPPIWPEKLRECPRSDPKLSAR